MYVICTALVVAWSFGWGFGVLYLQGKEVQGPELVDDSSSLIALILGFFVTTGVWGFGVLMQGRYYGSGNSPISLPVLGWAAIAGGSYTSLTIAPWPVDPAGWRLIPVMAISLATTGLVLKFLARRRRLKTQRALEETASIGTVTEGLVEDIPINDGGARIYVGVATVKFIDHMGTERWVQKIGKWRADLLPRKHDAVAVLFNPAHADDQSRIWIGPSGSKTAKEFLAWKP